MAVSWERASGSDSNAILQRDESRLVVETASACPRPPPSHRSRSHHDGTYHFRTCLTCSCQHAHCGHMEAFWWSSGSTFDSRLGDFVMHRQAIQPVRVPDHGL